MPALIPFDAQARKALELTFREALRLGHNYIGTEHILLALLELEDGEGVLTGLGIDKAAAETKVNEEIAAASRRARDAAMRHAARRVRRSLGCRLRAEASRTRGRLRR